MFELLRLSGSREEGIALQTRRRNNVKNAQGPEPDDYFLRKFERICGDHSNWIIRKPACGIYNCFGHVWAARRTAIYDQDEVEKILRDDEYRKLAPNEGPAPGDLAFYYDRSETSFLHVGLVCELEKLINGTGKPVGSRSVPWVLSKLDDVSGEVLHRASDFPKIGSDDHVIRYWTDRPA